MTNKKRNISDIGQLDMRVEFQNSAGVSDGAGGFVESWVTLMTVWAYVNDSGGVIYGSVNEHTQTTHNLVFTVRFNTAIYEKPITSMRLVFRDRAYKIRNIRNLNQANVYLEITCDGNDWEGV